MTKAFCSMLYRPIATVQSVETPEFRIIFATTKSVHGVRKELIMVYTRIGRDIGMTIWKKMRASEAPSTDLIADQSIFDALAGQDIATAQIDVKSGVTLTSNAINDALGQAAKEVQ